MFPLLDNFVAVGITKHEVICRMVVPKFLEELTQCHSIALTSPMADLMLVLRKKILPNDRCSFNGFPTRTLVDGVEAPLRGLHIPHHLPHHILHSLASLRQRPNEAKLPFVIGQWAQKLRHRHVLAEWCQVQQSETFVSPFVSPTITTPSSSPP